MILISSCLLGVHAKYDGTTSNLQPLLLKYINQGKFLPVCPEQLGGLGTPRHPVEIVGGSSDRVLAGKAKALNNLGEDITQAFVRGAQETLRLTELFPIRAAILKERSPSCGVHLVYNGQFNQTTQIGKGITAELLLQKGIPIYSEEEITEPLLIELLSDGIESPEV